MAEPRGGLRRGGNWVRGRPVAVCACLAKVGTAVGCAPRAAVSLCPWASGDRRRGGAASFPCGGDDGRPQPRETGANVPGISSEYSTFHIMATWLISFAFCFLQIWRTSPSSLLRADEMMALTSETVRCLPVENSLEKKLSRIASVSLSIAFAGTCPHCHGYRRDRMRGAEQQEACGR